jgi:transposase
MRSPLASDRSIGAEMIALPAGVKVWLAAGATDIRKRFDGLAALVQLQLAEDPSSGSCLSFGAKRVIG